MGHGASKQEPGMEMRPGMKLIQLKIEQVKRRVRRKSSIVSTAELLRPEEREGMVDDDSARGAAAMTEEEEEEGAGSPETIADADATSEEKVKEEKRIDEEDNVATVAAKEEEGKGVLGFSGADEDEDEDEDDDEGGRELRCLTADADLQESPSFRFYCTHFARDSEDEDSVKFGGGRREDVDKVLEMEEEEEEKVAHKNDDDTHSEDLEVKPLKKNKGRKFKALTKTPSRIYNFFNVQNCYNNHSSSIG